MRITRTFKPVGRCIYCGASECDLTDEHIIPLSLNGTLVLPQASCDDCADVTKAFEQTVARTMYGPLRVKRNFNTRHKKQRPSTLQILMVDPEGRQSERAVAVETAPTSYIAVELPPPGILSGAPLSAMNPEMKIHFKANTKELAAAQKALRAQSIGTRQVVMWGALCRLLAKIAHSYLFAVIGDQGYDALLPDIILGRSEFLSHFVGGTTEALSEEDAASELSVHLVPVGQSVYLIVYVQLLGRGRLPIYQVVGGKVTNSESVVTAVLERRLPVPNRT